MHFHEPKPVIVCGHHKGRKEVVGRHFQEQTLTQIFDPKKSISAPAMHMKEVTRTHVFVTADPHPTRPPFFLWKLNWKMWKIDVANLKHCTTFWGDRVTRNFSYPKLVLTVFGEAHHSLLTAREYEIDPISPHTLRGCTRHSYSSFLHLFSLLAWFRSLMSFS